MTDRAALGYWLVAFVATAIAVVACVAYVDRPVAEFFDLHVRHTMAWVWIERGLAPLNWIVVLELVLLFACGIWVGSGGALGSWTRAPLLCLWATMWAIAAEIIFKRIFGRGWPDPTYVRDGLFGFHWLHGGPHWEAFPSGTASTCAAIATVLWMVAPRWRTAGPLIAALLSVAVVVTNDHWVGDVIAGAFLGATIGWMTVRLAAAAPRN
ncbi:MAG: phosphatase PAP2 family protein [Candidatus Acidiferrales bacterium]